MTTSYTALVTGGGSGLGAATARAFAAAGARVLCLDRDGAAAAAVAAEIGGLSAEADVTDEAQVQAAIDAAVAAGPLRVCVNCAGIGTGGKTLGRDGPHPLALFQKTIAVNLVGTFNVARLAAAAMAQNEPIDNERGVIINTASIAAYEGQIGQAAYSASKGGVVGMTLPMARDLAPLGVRVMTIAPGVIETPMVAGLPEPLREALIAKTLMPKRLGRPQEFAELAVHIARNAMLNGSVIRLDGAQRLEPK